MIGDEKRTLFLVVAVCIFVLSPVVLLTLPTAIMHILYHSQSQLVLYIMGGGYLVYAAGVFFLLLSVLFIFFLWGRKSSILVSLFFLLLSGCSFYLAAQHYISIDADKLSYRMLFSFEEHTYHWEEFEKAFYYEDGSGKVAPTYEFILHDGESVILHENNYLKEYKRIISRLLRDKGIEYEKVFINDNN